VGRPWGTARSLPAPLSRSAGLTLVLLVWGTVVTVLVAWLGVHSTQDGPSGAADITAPRAQELARAVPLGGTAQWWVHPGAAAGLDRVAPGDRAAASPGRAQAGQTASLTPASVVPATAQVGGAPETPLAAGWAPGSHPAVSTQVLPRRLLRPPAGGTVHESPTRPAVHAPLVGGLVGRPVSPLPDSLVPVAVVPIAVVPIAVVPVAVVPVAVVPFPGYQPVAVAGVGAAPVLLPGAPTAGTDTTSPAGGPSSTATMSTPGSTPGNLVLGTVVASTPTSIAGWTEVVSRPATHPVLSAAPPALGLAAAVPRPATRASPAPSGAQPSAPVVALAPQLQPTAQAPATAQGAGSVASPARRGRGGGEHPVDGVQLARDRQGRTQHQGRADHQAQTDPQTQTDHRAQTDHQERVEQQPAGPGAPGPVTVGVQQTKDAPAAGGGGTARGDHRAADHGNRGGAHDHGCAPPRGPGA